MVEEGKVTRKDIVEEDENESQKTGIFEKFTHWTVVVAIVVVYGVNQGLGGALARVGIEYYMKDVQKVQPSEAQAYSGITNIPWIIKPILGLLTDVYITSISVIFTEICPLVNNS